MIGKRMLLTLTVLISLFWAANALALPPGSMFHFNDLENPGAVTTWTHTLTNSEFSPHLTGGELLNFTSATLRLRFDFTPVLKTGLYVAYFMASLDSHYIGDFFYWSPSYKKNVVRNWAMHITDSSILSALADKKADISLTPILGSINSVMSSRLRGTGVVAPEPISMVLLGAGLMGLPFARRLRRSIKAKN